MGIPIFGIYQPQFAQLSEAALKAHQPQFAKLNELVRNLQTAFPNDPTTLRINHLAFEVINSVVQDVSSSPSVQGQRPQKISDREIAAMLTVAVFLLVYITFSLAIKHNSHLAQLSATDGPTPFDAAMAAGAFAFWAWMTYSRRSS